MSEKVVKRLLPILFVALVAVVFLLIGMSVPPLFTLSRHHADANESANDTSLSEMVTSETIITHKICLNTAAKEELMSIDGIGEVMSQRIIDYRNEHGGFRTLEELKNIDGIGEKRYAQWSPHFTIS